MRFSRARSRLAPRPRRARGRAASAGPAAGRAGDAGSVAAGPSRSGREVLPVPAPGRQVGRPRHRGARRRLRARRREQGARLRRDRDHGEDRRVPCLPHRVLPRDQGREGHVPIGPAECRRSTSRASRRWPRLGAPPCRSTGSRPCSRSRARRRRRGGFPSRTIPRGSSSLRRARSSSPSTASRSGVPFRAPRSSASSTPARSSCGTPRSGELYLHLFDGFVEAPALAGPWTVAKSVPPDVSATAAKLAKDGVVDLMDGTARRQGPEDQAVAEERRARGGRGDDPHRAHRDARGRRTGCRSRTPRWST